MTVPDAWHTDGATRLRDLLLVLPATHAAETLLVAHGPANGGTEYVVTRGDLVALVNAARCEECLPQFDEDGNPEEDPEHDYRCHRLRTHLDEFPDSAHVWEAPPGVPGRPRIEWRS